MPQQNEWVEGNRLIAEFMKLAVYEKYGYLSDLDDDTVSYHSSWDWLMDVVEKIETIHDDHHGYFAVHIHANTCDIQGTNLWKAMKPGSTYGAVYMSDPNSIFPTKIESTSYAVVQFIKWYNQNQLAAPIISGKNK